MLSGNDLKRIGFTGGKAIGIALNIFNTQLAAQPVEAQLATAGRVLRDPSAYVNDHVLAPIALALINARADETVALVAGKSFEVYGAAAIEQGAITQMETAMRLPVTVAGALMPDAHQGYGLPIGGVLATNNAVIPYGVGVDIGCRMCMTLYNVPPDTLDTKRQSIKTVLVDNTRFGLDTFSRPQEHPVLDRPEFNALPILRQEKDRAWKQIGSSGGGNHFVEFGIVTLSQPVPEHNLSPGTYIALLSHSGSRGFGASVAQHYTKMAMASCKLPAEAKHLAWLDLDTDAGQQYWLAMNLAGDYASACHHQIHNRIASALGETPLAMIENHHNFAWREKDSAGNDLIVHRKGATPAGSDVLGIIPGSMATPGFIVRGKGNVSAINSASHGAGRTMSRTKAKQSILPGQVNKFLKAADVELIGAGVDEAPQAYKDIHAVMAHQRDLVDILGSFMPRIVRMCDDKKFIEAD